MKIKIAHVTASPLSLKFLLGDQLQYLARQGYEVHAISSPGIYADQMADIGVQWHPAGISRSITPLADLAGIRDVRNVCRRERFTIVHTHTSKGILLGQMGAFRARVPIVLQTLHGFYFSYVAPGLRQRLIRCLEFRSCRKAHHVLSQSPEDVDLILEAGVCPPSKVTRLGNGIDVQRFSPPAWDEQERHDRRRRLGLRPDGPVIGIVGRFVAAKGYRELCQALKGLAAVHPTIQVLAVGTNPSIDRPDEIVRPEQDPVVGDRFVCLYDRDDMEDLYRLMDLFVLPSYGEGFPRAAMEAAATGLAIVATDVRGCRHTVTDGENGLLIPARDPEALRSAIDRLLRQTPRRLELGLRGRQRALCEFDQQLVFQRVDECYRRLLEQRGISTN